MKKILVMIFVCCILLIGCNSKDVQQTKKDYSQYSFVDVHWTRTTEYDTEYIRFYSDGYFSYSCACGNPVNDADICETYSYNDETKEIKLECDEPSKYTITTIKVIRYDENTLELDFDGDIRKFVKE